MPVTYRNFISTSSKRTIYNSGGRIIKIKGIVVSSAPAMLGVITLSFASILPMNTAFSQSFHGNDVTYGPFTANAIYFYDNSVFNANTPKALTETGRVRLMDNSVLNASVEGAISYDGYQITHITLAGTSTVNLLAKFALKNVHIRIEYGKVILRTHNPNDNLTTLYFTNIPQGEDSYFALNGFNTTLANLNGGTSYLGGVGTVMNGSSNDSTLTLLAGYYGGVIEDGGVGKLTLVKEGDEELYMVGINTYTGGTIVNAGTMFGAAFNSSSTHLGNNTPYQVNGGTLDLYDYDLVMSSFSGAGGTLALRSANVDINQNTDTVFAGVIEGTGTVTKSNTGILVLSGTNTYTGGTNIDGGVLQLGNGGTSGSIVGDVANEGTLALDRSNELTLDGIISGSGELVQKGTGVTTLSGLSTYTGDTMVTAGTLAAGADNAFSVFSNFQVDTASTLALDNFAQELLSLQNNGTVDFGSVAGTELIVQGNYSGSDGILVLSAILAGDDSVTDILRVQGDTTGTHTLKVLNTGGDGAQTNEGIKIVKIGGASNATFDLLGDYIHEGEQSVVGGAYAYKLYQGGASTPTDGDWYLRSQLIEDDNGGPGEPEVPEPPLYQAGVPTYEVYPQALLAMNALGTLQQRVGNRSWSNTDYGPSTTIDNPVRDEGVWARLEGARTHVKPRTSLSQTTYDQTIFKLQAGVDSVISSTEAGKLVGGVTAHYTNGNTKTMSEYGDGEIGTNGYGFGGTLTWYEDSGFYLDAQAQLTWYRSDLNSLLAKTNLTQGNDAFGYAFSIEGGKRIDLDAGWSMTPQAQLAYSNITFDAFTDVFDARVSLDRGGSLLGRVGVTLDYENSWQNAKGTLDRSHFYGIANLNYEFLNGTEVSVADTRFASANDRVMGGLGFGGSINFDDDKYSIYGEGTINTSLNNFGDTHSLKGEVGFRMKW